MFDCDWSSDVCFPILLAATPNFRRRILAAGEMRELCTASPELHREAGQFAAKTGKVDWVIGVAGDASQIVEGAVAAGSPRERTKFFATPQEAAEFLETLVSPGRSEEHTSELQSQSNLVCRL